MVRRDGELPGVKFYVFVADNVLDADISGKNSGGEIGIFRDVNDDLHFVFRAAGQVKLRNIVGDGEDGP